MKNLFAAIVLFNIFSIHLSAQGVSPGCYCVEGQLRSVAAGEFLSTIVAGIQYSAEPCAAAFGQADGSNCVACLCTDDFNDAGLFQIQDQPLFTGSSSIGFTLASCENITEIDETLLFCGPCPVSQVGGLCEDFMVPDPDPVDNMDDATPIPTVGEWGILILCLSLLIFSIAVIREKHLTTQGN